MRKLSFLIVFLVFIVIINAQIRRSDVIKIAKSYSSLTWEVLTTNDNYSLFSTKGDTIIGTAYSYGDKNTASSFKSEINDSLIPRNWQENYNDSTRLLYTGIDCSGLVTRSLQFSDYLILNTGASKLNKYSIKTTNPLPGDIYASSHHCFLQGEDSGYVYEANSLDNPDDGNRVQYYKLKISDKYKKLTIFPLFKIDTEELTIITDSTEEIELSGSISCSGELTQFKLTRNGYPITPTTKSTSKSLSFVYMFTPTPVTKYRFICYSGNFINDLTYYDSIITDIYYLPNISEDYFICDSIKRLTPYPGYIFVDEIISVNMEDDDSIFLAGDSLGIKDHWVDDMIKITVCHEDGSKNSWEHNYSKENKNVTPLPPVNLTKYFKSGENTVSVVLQDDPAFAKYYGCSGMWFVQKHSEDKIPEVSILAGKQINNYENSGEFHAMIYDIIGRKLHEGTYNSFSLMEKEFREKIGRSGVFFYTATSNNKVSSGKICIMR